MVKILAGSYANEIYTLEFDPSTGSLSLSSSLTVGFHPSWITAHPSHPGSGTVIFTGLEQTAGEVIAVSFDKDGNGKIETRGISSQGEDPCSLLATKDELIVGNVSFRTRYYRTRLTHSIKFSTRPALSHFSLLPLKPLS